MKILLVDDEPAVLRVTALALERGGYEVIKVASAERALLICEELRGEVALVISDVSMPGMDGWELATCLAKDHVRVPLILMSGYPKPSPPAADPAGTDPLIHFRFIAKPFMPKKLLDLVAEVLEGVPAETPSQVG